MTLKSVEEVLTELGYGYLYRKPKPRRAPTFCIFCIDADLEELELYYGCKVCGNGGYYDMTEKDFIDRATRILHNMALEVKRPWWRRLFIRWAVHHEPLRNDAARLLRDARKDRIHPIYDNDVGYVREDV